MDIRKTTRTAALLAALALSMSLAGFITTIAETGAPEQTAALITETGNTETVRTFEGSALKSEDLFTSRDLEQTADLSEAEAISLKDGENISITEEGVYVLSGSAKNVTVTVDTQDTEEAKVQIVLDGVTITNTDFPAIYVKSADKVFITTAEGSVNSLSVTGTFKEDGTTNTDAVIFSKDDLTLNGLGTLNISSSDNGIVSKDDLRITGGTYVITAADHAVEANDSIRISDGTFELTSGKDGLHAGDDDDASTGYVYIGGGTLNIEAEDDAIHAVTILEIDDGDITMNAHEGLEATWVQINGGKVNITAGDDGINAANKSSAYATLAEITGGEITIVMSSGDTDAIDSNGSLVISGGSVDITGPSAFDFDGSVSYTGGTLTVNGKPQSYITSSMAAGGMQGRQRG